MGTAITGGTRGISVRLGAMALLAGLMGITAVAAEPGDTWSSAPPRLALLVRHPEVRKAQTVHWKPFLPVLPSAAALSFRDPRTEWHTGYGEIPPISSIPPARMEPPEMLSSEIPDGFQVAENEPISSISRPPDQCVSLKEEMLTLEDLDTGKYGGMAAFSKGDLQGFLRIPTVWAEQMHLPDNLKPAVYGLTEGMNRYSPVRTEVSPHLYLSSGKILRMPFLLVTTDNAFELTPAERRNFAEYITNGGFVFLDTGTPQFENSAAEASLRQMVRDSLGSRAHFEPLPVSHPLYHCWFDFKDGPPQVWFYNMQNTDTADLCGYSARASTMQKPVFYLEGIFLDGQMVGVFSKKGYTTKWSMIRPSFSESVAQLQFGVNLVVYALTREGGMNARLMEGYSDIR